VPADAPPLFLAAAGDDELVDARNSLDLYAAWRAAGRRAELHLYAEGGHGFALIPHDLPVDDWNERFREWLVAEDFVPRPDVGAGRPPAPDRSRGRDMDGA
jgi:acetyl esterase/lipase